jgi:tRNA (guanine-N7-)-methyltransferase
MMSMRENRSYVIRATRMSPHQREALERLSSTYCLPAGPDAPLLDWDAVYPQRRIMKGRPLILDIGFGMGYELAQLAASRPDTDFLGVEVHAPGVGKLLSEIERRSLQNIRILRDDAVTVCAERVPAASLAGIHVFFPDPWPKKRHHKRRLVRPGFAELVAPLLVPDGYLYLVTDWEDYALQMMRVLDASALVRNGSDGFAPPQPWRPETAFERKGRARGHRIFELRYLRQSSLAT